MLNSFNQVRDRNNSEPSWYKNSEPVAECWFCNEDLYEGEAIEYKGYSCCGRDECVEAIALETGADINV